MELLFLQIKLMLNELIDKFDDFHRIMNIFIFAGWNSNNSVIAKPCAARSHPSYFNHRVQRTGMESHPWFEP